MIRPLEHRLFGPGCSDHSCWPPDTADARFSNKRAVAASRSCREHMQSRGLDSRRTQAPISGGMHIPNRSADRSEAIARAHAHFDDGDFVETLRRRVAIPSSSQEPERAAAMQAYLRDEMAPALAPLGFASRIFDNPQRRRPAVPGGRAHRGPAMPDRAGLRPRRHRPRARRPVAAGTGAVDAQRRRRSHLRPRHRRQQGPAQHQHRGARAPCSRSAASSASTSNS